MADQDAASRGAGDEPRGPRPEPETGPAGPSEPTATSGSAEPAPPGAPTAPAEPAAPGAPTGPAGAGLVAPGPAGSTSSTGPTGPTAPLPPRSNPTSSWTSPANTPGGVGRVRPGPARGARPGALGRVRHGQAPGTGLARRGRIRPGQAPRARVGPDRDPRARPRPAVVMPSAPAARDGTPRAGRTRGHGSRPPRGPAPPRAWRPGFPVDTPGNSSPSVWRPRSPERSSAVASWPSPAWPGTGWTRGRAGTVEETGSSLAATVRTRRSPRTVCLPGAGRPTPECAARRPAEASFRSSGRCAPAEGPARAYGISMRFSRHLRDRRVQGIRAVTG